MRGIAVLMISLALGACASPGQKRVYAGMDETEHKMKTERAAADKVQSQQKPYFQVIDELYVGADAVPLKRDADEPAVLRERTVYRSSYPATLQQLAGYVSENHGIAVNVTQDALEAAGRASQDGHQQLLDVARNRGETGIVSAQTGGTGGTTGTAGGWIQIQYDGPLKGFLDQITSRTGTGWRYSDGKISIFYLDTRTFRISTFYGASTFSSTISNEATGGSSSGSSGASGGSSGSSGGAKTSTSSGQSTKLDATADMLGSARDTIQAMLSPAGKLAVGTGAATITVTDTATVLDRVDRYVRDLNKQLTRQVRIETKVYTLELSDDESYGINWTGVWQSVANKYGITASSFGNVDPVQSSQFGFSVLDPNNRFSGSNVVLSALAQQGKLASVTSSENVTLSNRPVPVQVTRDTGHIQTVQTNLVANAGAQTTVTTGTVTTGFSMQLLPVVLDGPDLLMQAQFTLSNLRDLRKIQVGLNVVEVPEVDSRQFLQQVEMKSGSTLVLAGYEADLLQGDTKGVTPGNVVLGGSRGTTKARTVLVILITPVILN